jgi:hypothetical protein
MPTYVAIYFLLPNVTETPILQYYRVVTAQHYFFKYIKNIIQYFNCEKKNSLM